MILLFAGCMCFSKWNLLSRAHKKLSAIGSWENSKKAAVEAELKQMEVMRKQNICNVFMFYCIVCICYL